MKLRLLIVIAALVEIAALSPAEASPVVSTASGTAGAKGRESAPGRQKIKVYSAERKGYLMVEKVVKPEEEWKKLLTPIQYEVTRRSGTERAFTGAYWNTHDRGVYRCVCCGTDLFASETKFDSGTGWPSFWKPIAPENVAAHGGASMLTGGSEIRCSRCDAHLGHVFDDGPEPTGLRYCMNSAALKFEPGKK